MEAQLAWVGHSPVPNEGNPGITMLIPQTDFNKVIHHWLSEENVNNLIKKSYEIDWQPQDYEKPFFPLPEVYVEYIP